MKGTEVPVSEMILARKFLKITSGLEWNESDDGKMCLVSSSQLVQLIAWYGSVRSKGDGSGQLVVDGKAV